MTNIHWTNCHQADLGMPLYTRDRVASLRAFTVTMGAVKGAAKGFFPGTPAWRPPS